MILYLSLQAHDYGGEYVFKKYKPEQLNVLLSFQYAEEIHGIHPKQFRNFMADSGAFTAMNAGIKIDGKYIDSYIEWVKKFEIQNYIEMDLDEIVGYQETISIRKYIENKVGRQSIPVWHKERGFDEWKKMCMDYPYVAISLSGATSTSKWLAFHKYKPIQPLMNVARKNLCKVHALGCNKWGLMHRFHFYSVDSSCHSLGYRYGVIYQFKDGRIHTVKNTSQYMLNGRKIAEHNVDEMIKGAEYAFKKL